MNVKEIIELVDFISKKRLEEVKIETEAIKLSIKKSAAQNKVVEQTVVHTAPAVAAAPAPIAAPVAAAPAPAAVPQAKVETATASNDDNLIPVKSPMIGTFYRSANPESPSFANVGDKIETGQTVCIVEAMKLFNEIETDISGTIVKVMVENAQPVEYDQVLFLVDPS
jgi:acetyl-CoA carboxylase biotin carboxyl carrier protein